MSEMFAYGDIKLFAGSGCPELAQRISEYIGTPLSSWGHHPISE